MAIAVGGGTGSTLKYLLLPSLYSGNAKPFITTEIPSGTGEFSVQ